MAKDKTLTYKALVRSTRIAIEEYRHRHNGNNPAKILVSDEAYTIMACSGLFRFEPIPNYGTIFGIPLQVSSCEGCHIHLAEPEIPLYAWMEDHEPKIYFQPTEGTE